MACPNINLLYAKAKSVYATNLYDDTSYMSMFGSLMGNILFFKIILYFYDLSVQ